MRVRALQLHDWRCWRSLRWMPAPGINCIVGGNGSGKTSLLEALHLLSHGRSFRSGGTAALVRQGAARFSVYAEIEHDTGLRRSALQRDLDGTWQARLDGAAATRLTDVLGSLAVVCFEPGSQGLIAAGPEGRRRFLDWGLFHVEQGFLLAWQQYRRALLQRNALLQRGGDSAEFSSWEIRMAEQAVRVDALRRTYLQRLQEPLRRHLGVWLPELGVASLRYQRGWAETEDLAAVLRMQRARDQQTGYTRAGPQRADWSLEFELARDRHQLSRGQTKLAALAALLAQFDLHRSLCGETSLLLLDDLASELDAAHYAAVLDFVRRCDAQVLLTSTAAQCEGLPQASVFHVEQAAQDAVEGWGDC